MTDNKASVKSGLLVQAAALEAQATTLRLLAKTLPDEEGGTRKRYTTASNPVGENAFRRLCKLALETGSFTVYRGARSSYECDAVEFDAWRDSQVHKPRPRRVEETDDGDALEAELLSGGLVRGAK